jgi:hypothetical protein
MDLGNLLIKMEILLKVNGFTTRQTVLGRISVKKVVSMRATGEEIYSMARASKVGKTEAITKESSKMALSRALANITGKMEILMKGSGRIINSMEKVLRNWQMGGNIKAVGRKGLCMEGAIIFGQMDKNTKVSTT